MIQRKINVIVIVLAVGGCLIILFQLWRQADPRPIATLLPATVAERLVPTALAPKVTLSIRTPVLVSTPTDSQTSPTSPSAPIESHTPQAHAANPSVSQGAGASLSTATISRQTRVLTGTFSTSVPVQISPSPTLPVPTEAASSVSPTPAVSNRWRFGTVNRLGELELYDMVALNPGWVLAGAGGSTVPAGVGQLYGIWVQAGTFLPPADQLVSLVAARPGATWQVGNEPDVIWQSNCTPEEYARVYHELYTLIKGVDPTARVAAGVISQATPLRLQYLDLVLAAYQRLFGAPMPVDIWSVHNSILREERDSWGVDIPPGITADTGQLYGIDDNDRLDIFIQQLRDFRTWMRDQGYRDRPLYLTEFGILMPADYGYPPERVVAFMAGAFDYLLAAIDDQLGYPSDGNRLVQRWAWYSIAATDYPTGNLFDPDTKEMTVVGETFARFTAGE